jgi:hypothetical protein
MTKKTEEHADRYEMPIPFLPKEKAHVYAGLAEQIRLPLQRIICEKNQAGTLHPEIRYDEDTGNLVLSIEAAWAGYARGVLQAVFHELPLQINEHVNAGIDIKKNEKMKAVDKVLPFERFVAPENLIDERLEYMISSDHSFRGWMRWAGIVCDQQEMRKRAYKYVQDTFDKLVMEDIMEDSCEVFRKWQEKLSEKLDSLQKSS